MTPTSWYPNFSQRFNALVTRYHQQVANVFWGHTHHSELQLFTTNDDPPVPHTVAYIGGSVSSGGDTNPGFQTYNYDRAAVSDLSYTRLVTDYSVYWMDIMEANREGQAHWGVHLSGLKDLGLKDLTPESWYALADSIKHGGSVQAYTNLVIAFRRGYDTNTSAYNATVFACDILGDSQEKRAACLSSAGWDAEEVRELQLQQEQAEACKSPSEDEAEEIMAKVQLMRAKNALDAIQQRRRERAHSSSPVLPQAVSQW